VKDHVTLKTSNAVMMLNIILNGNISYSFYCFF